VQGNPDKRTIIYTHSDINSSNIFNIAKRNAEILCKGKTKLISGQTPNDKVACYVGNITINDSSYNGKTIIVENGNVTMNYQMTRSSPAIDLFISK